MTEISMLSKANSSQSAKWREPFFNSADTWLTAVHPDRATPTVATAATSAHSFALPVPFMQNPQFPANMPTP
jgi:hypothetical protein